MTRFYVELPCDKEGNTALPDILPAGRAPVREYDNVTRPLMMIAGPPGIAARWPSLYADQYGGFAETEGPARMLTRAEYRTAVINATRADQGE